MRKMKDVAILLGETKDRLYDFGMMDEQFIQGVKLLCELGFEVEVNCMLNDFENFIFNNV